jgi:hypothetical protein
MTDLLKGTTRFVLLGGTFAASALAMAAPSTPRSAGETVREALREQGPIVTEEERAYFRAKCGDDGSLSLSSREGAVVCKDGREIDDPEARAMLSRILARANDHVARALGRREVAEAINGEAHAKVREELRKLDSAEMRETMRRAMEAAKISLAEIDMTAIQAEALAAAQASLAEIDVAQIMRDAETKIDRAEIDRALREAAEELARERRRLEARDK